MSPMFRSLEVRNYRIYASGAFVSNVGTWLQNTAQAWLVLQLTGNGAVLGLVVALQLLPSLLFSPLAGVAADRFDKRKMLIWMQLAMAAPAAVLGVLAVTGTARAWHVFVIAFTFGIARAFEAPARQAFVSEMVDSQNLANAVSLNSASFNAGRLIGPGLAGLLIALLGSGVDATGWVILANAASYGFVVWALFAMDVRHLDPAPRAKGGNGALRDGVRYVRSRPDLLLLFTIVFFVGAFGMNFQITSALMATQVFGKGAGEFGILGSVLAIGSLAGALLAARRPAPRMRFIVIAGLSFAIVQILSGIMPTFWTYTVVLPLVGLTVLTVGTTASAMIQVTADPVFKGRVVSLYIMVFLGSVPLGAPIIGWIGEHVGAREAIVTSGLLTGLGILIATIAYARRLPEPVIPNLVVLRRPVALVTGKKAAPAVETAA